MFSEYPCKCQNWPNLSSVSLNRRWRWKFCSDKYSIGVHCRPKYRCFTPLFKLTRIWLIFYPSNLSPNSQFSQRICICRLRNFFLLLAREILTSWLAKWCKSDAQMEMTLTQGLNNWVGIIFFLSWGWKNQCYPEWNHRSFTQTPQNTSSGKYPVFLQSICWNSCWLHFNSPFDCFFFAIISSFRECRSTLVFCSILVFEEQLQKAFLSNFSFNWNFNEDSLENRERKFPRFEIFLKSPKVQVCLEVWK